MAALLLAGLAVGVTLPGRFTQTFGDATLYIFLPALIFEAAWHLDFHIVRRMWKPIALLVLPGVLITAAIVATFVGFFGHMSWGAAVLLGAILCATDPVAVVAIFRRLRVPPTLSTIVESESLLNDAVAIVLYRAIIASIMVSSGVPGVLQAASQAVIGVIIGVVVGVLLAYLAAFVLRAQVGAPVQSIATLIGAYAGYFVCDRFGWSGIFAVLTFGVALRELERNRISVQAAEGVSTFWEVVAVLANVALFFLIGAALDFRQLTSTIWVQLIALAAVLVARLVLSYGLLALVRGYLRQFWMTAVQMAGIRGALSLALALATPVTVVQRSTIIDATFAVVVVTLLSSALTLKPRMERLPLGD